MVLGLGRIHEVSSLVCVCLSDDIGSKLQIELLKKYDESRIIAKCAKPNMATRLKGKKSYRRKNAVYRKVFQVLKRR